MAGREGENISMELSDILSAGELDDLNHLVVSCFMFKLAKRSRTEYCARQCVMTRWLLTLEHTPCSS